MAIPAMIALFGILSYLLGAVPFGLLVARARGIDIRKVGSCNIGATNVFRCVGKGWGILTFLLDALKGFVPACLFPLLLGRLTGQPAPPASGLVFMLLAIAGHNWPVYLGFKGGKGVATSAGGLLGVAPAAVGIGLAVWVAVFALSRYVSVASIVAAAAVAVSAWLLYASAGLLIPIAMTLLAAVLIVRHRANIRRLMQGTENRFEFGRGRKAPAAQGAQNGSGS